MQRRPAQRPASRPFSRRSALGRLAALGLAPALAAPAMAEDDNELMSYAVCGVVLFGYF